MELDLLYVDVIVARYEQFTGKQASLAERTEDAEVTAPARS